MSGANGRPSDEDEAVASVTNLRARFEQLTAPYSSPIASARPVSPFVSPKPPNLSSINSSSSSSLRRPTRASVDPSIPESATPALVPTTGNNGGRDGGSDARSANGLAAPLPLQATKPFIRSRATSRSSSTTVEAAADDEERQSKTPSTEEQAYVGVAAVSQHDADRVVGRPSSALIAAHESRSISSTETNTASTSSGSVMAASTSEENIPRPLIPVSSRPSSSTITPASASNVGSTSRKVPPPIPASRKAVRATSPNISRSFTSPSPLKIDTPASTRLSSTDKDPVSPSLAAASNSVKNLASRFTAQPSLQSQLTTEQALSQVSLGSPHQETPSQAASSPFPSTVEVDEAETVPLEYSDEEEEQAEEALEEVESFGRMRSESPEVFVTDYSTAATLTSKARPVVPPRPSLNGNSSTSTSSSSRNISPHATRSATSPVLEKAALPPETVLVGGPLSTMAVPPPPRKLPPPVKKTSDPIPVRLTPKVPTRPNASISSPPPFTPALNADVYVPPPPPSRALGANERLAPQRPILSHTSDEGGGSSEDEEEEFSASKAQELPDATFANRRPPLLRNRRPIHPQGQFYSFALRNGKVVTGQHHVYVWNTAKTSTGSESISLPGEHKVHSINFVGKEGRFVWAGTKDGHIFEVDLVAREVMYTRHHVHSASVIGIHRIGQGMLTIDDNGKVLIWGDDAGSGEVALQGTCRGQRVPEKQNFHAVVGTELWTSSGPNTKSGASSYSTRLPQIRIFDTTGKGPWVVLARPLTLPDSVGSIGAVTASAIVPEQNHLVFLGHDNGYVSVWNRSTHTCEKVRRVSPFMATSMVGVGKDLWIGYRNGMISVYDVSSDELWTVKKAWKAHRDPVQQLVVDPTALWSDGTLQVASAASDVQLWDGMLRDDWLDAELHLRQPEYCTFRSIKTLCISWNVDASRPNDLVGTQENLDFLHDVLLSVDSPDIISFGFQEMINLEDKKLTAKSMLLGKKKTEQKFGDAISSSYRIWHDKLVHAVRLTMPPECPYTVVHVGDMIGLFSCIFVKSSEASQLSDIAQITVKTGMGGRYGNKGAILSRFVIDDTSVCFINCHLAAGQSHRRQRDHDLVDILEDKSTFSELGAISPGAYALGSGGTTVFDHELVVLSGDLNYRIDARRDAVVQAINEGNLATLLAQDQLLKGLANDPAFRLRSFKEPTITFAPTYKYDPGSDEYDTSNKRRIPAWCDRVLYRADRTDKIVPLPNQYRRWEVNVSDHRPISSGLEFRIKRIIPEKRALVWTEVENAWIGVGASLLAEARRYYQDW